MPKGLRIRRDHVIEAMVRGLGARVVEIEAPFDPEGGAYADSSHAQAGEGRHATDPGHGSSGHGGHPHDHHHDAHGDHDHHDHHHSHAHDHK
jgi:urease accessory protein